MSNDYEHLTQLDDPERPWRKVWRCPATDVYVKTYAQRTDGALGKVTFAITVSACDANGTSLTRPDGSKAIYGGEAKPRPRLLQINPMREDDEPIADKLDRELRYMIARVERAVLNEREAAGL